MPKHLIFPQQNDALLVGDYRLPITIQNPDQVTGADISLIETMKEFTPETRFKEGDLAILINPSPNMRQRYEKTGRMIPRLWQVRHVISVGIWELIQLQRNGTDVLGMDHAIALFEEDGIVGPQTRKPMIYAHGFPHAWFPNTAQWFYAHALKKTVLRDPSALWPNILDEAQTEFVGYEDRNTVVLDLAPDLYGLGMKRKSVFSHEENAAHAAASLGLEELMAIPMSPKQPVRKAKHEEDSYDDEDDDD